MEEIFIEKGIKQRNLLQKNPQSVPGHLGEVDNL